MNAPGDIALLLLVAAPLLTAGAPAARVETERATLANG